MGRINLRVQPRASRDEISGWLDADALRVRVTAPPEDGKANAAVVKLLARQLGVARSDVEIVSGRTSRNKVVEVAGLSADEIRQML